MNGDNVLPGAAWGSHMLRRNARALWRRSWGHMLEDPIVRSGREAYGPDQLILARCVCVFVCVCVYRVQRPKLYTLKANINLWRLAKISKIKKM